jgi:hypothetical protein
VGTEVGKMIGKMVGKKVAKEELSVVDGLSVVEGPSVGITVDIETGGKVYTLGLTLGLDV